MDQLYKLKLLHECTLLCPQLASNAGVYNETVVPAEQPLPADIDDLFKEVRLASSLFDTYFQFK